MKVNIVENVVHITVHQGWFKPVAGGGTDPALVARVDALASDAQSLTNRIDDNDARLNDLTDASPLPWNDGAYVADSVVRHNGSMWLARNPAALGDEPGVSPKWASLTLESIWHTAHNAAGQADLNTVIADLAALTARVTALETPP